MIPGVQVGSRVSTGSATGQVTDVFVAERPVYPVEHGGCLQCNVLISADQLQREAISPEERRQQAYVDDVNVTAPSVITLNALAWAQAADDFLFSFLRSCDEDRRNGYLMHFPRERVWRPTACAAKPDCYIAAPRRSRRIHARCDAVAGQESVVLRGDERSE
jgi:hypothetical protein